MGIRGITVLALGAGLAVGGCAGGIETDEADDAVPAGAVPAATDARPGAGDASGDDASGDGGAARDTAASALEPGAAETGPESRPDRASPR